MIILDKNEKQLLGKQGWIIKDNTLITKALEYNVMEFYTLTTKSKIRQLINLTLKSKKPNIKNTEFINIMTEIAKIEKELGLYESDNEKVGL